MTELSGYVFSPLRAGDFTFYRGSGNGLAPILLVTAEDASVARLKRLEHEYALRADLNAVWAARPVALCRYNDRLTLVLEDPGGEPLDRLLGERLAMPEFLRIAIPLAQAVRQVHERGLVHKDIKPGNMLVNMESGSAWLTGFGIAVRLPQERHSPEPPEVIAGTLAYMSPEQTGRMNRSVDSRCDLYSLGITFYEMLTGTLPFTAADPMEWVHCHIARQPTPPDERATVPRAVSAIVMKLLAKTAEDRYQTAAGVEADLRRCLAEWEVHGRIDPFAVGAHDASDRLMIPERLYGREREIEGLLAAFDRVMAYGTPELVLVSGYSGIGKSSVVNELHKVLVPPRGLFASGKFDQYKRDIPYATLAQAFQSLIRPILGQSEEQLGQWRATLREALGPNGQLIVNLVPELELVIGIQPAVPEVPPREAKNRFQMVFRHFLSVFAQKEHPLALFLDDLQWLDTATLDLIEQLVTHSEVHHLLLVGAYRDNEVSPTHPLTRMLGAVRTAGARVREIVLAPLGLDDVGRLVAGALHCEPEQALPLTRLVQEKTNGNPFFAIQFFTALAEEGLLAFDPIASAWEWDIDRIRAKNYTDNVADLMVTRLRRFSATTQEALKQLAYLGNVAEIASLTLFHGDTEEAMHGALWEAVVAGLVLREDNAYKFLHDRIQQAAYSLIPEEHRAEVHLRIGRVLLASMTADGLAKHLFDVANQFNRGTAMLVDPEEKVQVATINLRAGRKAKASAAYASACAYLESSMSLLDESDWGNHYSLMFNLWLERAECELVTANFDKAEHLIGELLQRGASKVDQAAGYHLKVLLHIVKGENPQAVAVALACLNLFGINMPAHPSWDHVQTAYETMWESLDGRPIESLIDLPLMTDPELQAAMQVLSTLTPAAYFTDFHLWCLHLCQMVSVSVKNGTSDAAAHAYAYSGVMLGPVFHRYRDAQRLAKLACDLVEKHGFIAYHAKVHYAMGTVAFWTQPVARAIDTMRAGFRAAIETGDLTFACYSMFQCVTGLLLRNDSLDAVWRESETVLDFARAAKYGDAGHIIVCQQRFIATMQGRTATFSTFSDAQFDEATFEAQLSGDRMSAMIAWYWILKLKARFLSGDYVEALAAADKAKALLSAAAAQIQLLDYFYYTALTVAALYENAAADEQDGWHGLLTAHREQLREWADNYPPTFGDKLSLVSAEIARLEGRDPDAMRLYEQAIQSAREHGFVQNEGLAHEVAAQFYAARGFETIAHAYLRNARHCYLRWGALGKARQLDRRHPRLREESAPFAPTATIGAPFEQLDLGTVVKASQAVSGEIELGKLIETLLRIAIEHAGAGRGLLILFRGDEPRIAAEATTDQGVVEVTLRQAAVTPSELPESVLHYVIRTREIVILDDATAPTLFSADAYVQQRPPRSVLCFPLIKQAKLVGALYLENNLTPRAFTSGRIAVLELLASQAAISLENARLYSDLQHSEAFLAEGQSISSTGSFRWNVASGDIYWSGETFQIFDYDQAAKVTLERILQRVHPDDRSLVEDTIDRASRTRTDFDFEHRLLMPNCSVKHLHVIAHAMQNTSGNLEFVGALMDVTEQKWAQAERARLEQRLRQAEKMEAVGRLAGGIAHDFNNVLAGVLAYGEMILDEAPGDSPLKRHAQNVLTAASRGRGLVEQILAYSRSQRGKRVPVDVAHVVAETLELIRGSLPANVRLEASAPELPLVVIGDATQLHQTVMNLCSNAIQAMPMGGALRVALEAAEFPDERALSHGTLEPGRYVRLIVEDSGSGMDETTLARIFEPFFTTKEVGRGTGLGLSLVYAIITDWGGTIDVKSAAQQGSTFTIFLRHSEVTLAVAEDAASTPPRGRGERVLLIDDEAQVLTVTAAVLSRLGYEPEPFSESHAALAAFEAAPERFDVVVTDQVMSGLTGTGLARVLRRHRPDLPIVLVSGYSGAILTQDALDAGVSELLTKPLQSHEIATTLARVLHRTA
jgi:predicted ATPase/signal transduction histidine kinase/GAF domain-containing protein/CheY-like chemotaxis protein